MCWAGESFSAKTVTKSLRCTTPAAIATVPRCSGNKRVDFHEKASQLIIDGVVYYQVVMTLPSELSQLAMTNRELFGGLLPKSAWSSLDRTIRREQGYQAAAISVLHTWNQQLDNHWHVHLLVPGAGPSVDNQAGPQRHHRSTATTTKDSISSMPIHLRSRFRTTILASTRQQHVPPVS